MTVVEPLSASIELSFDYTRSLGPTLSRFMTALAGRRLIGGRGSDGRIYVPPLEYDPITGAAITDFVDVGDHGEVLSWSWAADPLAGQPLDRPFAWALVKLDGADTAMLHAVDAGDESKMSTGMRVKVRWTQDNVPDMSSIACFDPEGS